MMNASTLTWDMVVLSVAGLGAVARPIVAGLDVRKLIMIATL